LIQLIKGIRDLIEEIPKFGADSRTKLNSLETHDCCVNGVVTQRFKLNLI
jgi:hypothetical protein